MKFYKKYKPLLELNNSKYSVIALTGGRGSGKTTHALFGLLQACGQEKKKVCFFRETKDTLTNSLKAELDGMIDSEFQEVEDDALYTSTNDKITNNIGSYMFFKGLKEVNQAAIENLKGIATTTDFFVIDEAQAVSKSVWDVLIPTLRKAGCVLIVIYNRITDDLPVEEALFLSYDTMTAPDNTYFIEVNYTEIEHLGVLSKEFLDRAELLKKNKPDEFETFYLNKPNRGNQNYVVKYFTSDNIKEINYLPDMDLHITCDFNVDPMAWVLAHKTDEKVFFFDEIVIENTTTKQCTEEFCRRYPNHAGNIIINGDASGDNRNTASEYTNYVIIKNTLQDFGYHKVEFNLRPSNPSIIKRRIPAWNNKVLTNKGERHLFIDPKCKWLIYNCKNLRFKEGTTIIDEPGVTRIKTDKESKFLGHPFAAASYLVEFYFPVVMDYLPDPPKPLTIQEQWNAQR